MRSMSSLPGVMGLRLSVLSVNGVSSVGSLEYK